MSDKIPLGTTRCHDDQIERVLSAQQWRVVHALLDERVIPADPIFRPGETVDAEASLTVCYELHHVLLPELAALRVIEFDRADDEIRRGPRFNEVRRRLEQIAADRDT